MDSSVARAIAQGVWVPVGSWGGEAPVWGLGTNRSQNPKQFADIV